ncbi:MAG: YheU family protein [Myxococcota bacterium]
MVIPYQQLDSETLRNIIEAFVLREGTDYGHRDYTIDEKVDVVLRQLKRGDVVLTWDAELETCNLVSRRDLRRQPEHP